MGTGSHDFIDAGILLQPPIELRLPVVLTETVVAEVLSENSMPFAVHIRTPEELDALAQAAQQRFAEFEEIATAILTPEKAALVRKWRLDHGYTWRDVATEAYDRFGGSAWEDWRPPSNQLVGRALCKEAAKHFGQDYTEAPWS